MFSGQVKNMKKSTIKAIVLTSIFFVAIITFSILTNKENKDLTITMSEVSLPVVQFVYGENVVNELHGYVNKMNVSTMRGSITPLNQDGEIALEILGGKQEITNISYEIRSMNGERLVVDQDNVKFQKQGHKLLATLELPNLFEYNKEYSMVLSLTSEGKEIYYYTRIMQPVDCYVDECLDFALQFHDYSFREDADQFIPTYMDPATGDATRLNYVDLSCTLKQITWGDFDGVPFSKPVIEFEEIHESYSALTLNYILTNVNEKHETEYYNVEEYYRLRKTETRMYVLNFERRTNQILRSENEFIIDREYILLGIRDADVEYMANESGDNIAFVQEGDLWSYNRLNNTISKVFSFRSVEGINVRENWNQYDIRIIRIDEAGSIEFVVYGYMNRGIHEGETGILVYHYDGISHTVEEELFISSEHSYDCLSSEFGQLLYVNEQKELYFIMHANMYKVDLNSLETTLVLENISPRDYAISKSNAFFAWVDPANPYHSTEINLMDLKSGEVHKIQGRENEYLRPLGFLEDDFIYGIAESVNVEEDFVGTIQFPMRELRIMNCSDKNKTVIKNYIPEQGYIGSIGVDGNIYVNLIEERDGIFSASGQDVIMNREAEDVNGVHLATYTTDVKQKQVAIKIKKLKKSNTIKSISASHVLLEKEKTIKIDYEMNQDWFYVYVRGKAILATTNPGEAILCANKSFGVVVNQNRDYIWKRARAASKAPLKGIRVHQGDRNSSSTVQCISAMLQLEQQDISVQTLVDAGRNECEVLDERLTNAMVLDLKNCSLDEIYYFIDQGVPVMTSLGTNQSILLVGYNASGFYCYNPMEQNTKLMDKDTLEERIKSSGSRFVTYVKLL